MVSLLTWALSEHRLEVDGERLLDFESLMDLKVDPWFKPSDKQTGEEFWSLCLLHLYLEVGGLETRYGSLDDELLILDEQNFSL